MKGKVPQNGRGLEASLYLPLVLPQRTKISQGEGDGTERWRVIHPFIHLTIFSGNAAQLSIAFLKEMDRANDHDRGRSHLLYLCQVHWCSLRRKSRWPNCRRTLRREPIVCKGWEAGLAWFSLCQS